MLIFLYGPDDYRREEKRRSIKEEFLKKNSGLSAGSFDLLEPEAPEQFRNFIRAQSIFETKKIVFVEHAFDIDPHESLIKELTALIENKNTTVVLSERGKPLKAFSFLLEKPVLAQEFKNLEGKEWERFIASVAKERGVEFEAGALGFLARVYAGNSWGLVTELEKVRTLGTRPVSQKDLEAAMLEAVPDYWGLMNGLRSPDLGRRLSALQKLFSANEPAAKAFNILSSMWKEKARQFANYDLKIKSGKLEYEEALLDTVLG